MYRAEANPGPMADPPAGAPEPSHKHPGNDHQLSVDDVQRRVNVDSLGSLADNRKRMRSGNAFTPSERMGRVTTRGVWKLIRSLKGIIWMED